jgi:hypothetical protein
MRNKQISREELENLYSHEGISRKELRYLLRVSPNQITSRLSDVFKKELNPFKFTQNRQFNLRGFVHSAPKRLKQMFNSIHYSILNHLGQYSLYILSSSPSDLSYAIPLVIPNEIVGKNKVHQAHFAEITGTTSNLNQFEHKSMDAIFVIAKEIKILGFDELFSIVDPIINLTDIYGMIKDRFNSTKIITDSIILWLMSSPEYESRAGGNAFSPISPSETKFKCNPDLLINFHTDLVSTPIPYFRHANARTQSKNFMYDRSMKCKLTYHKNSDINYNFEPDLDKAMEFLNTRTPQKSKVDLELNISTTTLELDPIKKRPLESFLKKPIIDAKVLTQTDLPVLFTNNDLVIEESETELFDFSMEISQLIYQSRMRLPHSPYTMTMTASAVKSVMDEINRSNFELHELMSYGIIFNPGLIGGLGEHLTRISNSVLRLDKDADNSSHENEHVHEAFNKSEKLFEEYITKLTDEYNPYISAFYYQFEDSLAEQDQIKNNKLRSTVNTVLFELNNIYKVGWRYSDFEEELKKRTGYGKKRINDLFQSLIHQNDITECSPGLYLRILGFDKYQ